MLPAVVDAKGVVINLTGPATREHAYPFLQTTEPPHKHNQIVRLLSFRSSGA